MVLDALESVRAQVFRPIELIVVDDGSTDDTCQQIERWQSENEESGFDVRYIYQENSGGNVARNRGIKSASGKWIAFLDSDDLWHPQKLCLQSQEFTANPEFGAVYCGLEKVIYETGHALPIEPRKYPTGDLGSQLLIRDVTSPTSAYMIRREVFMKCGRFDEQLQARQDWDMWIRISEHYPIGCVPENLVQYRQHEGERTISNPMKELRAYRHILDKNKDRLRQQSVVVRRKAWAAYYRRSGRVHFHQKISHPRAVWLLVRSILCWPFEFDTWAALAGTLIPGNLRRWLHHRWNQLFGRTAFGIQSH